MGRLQNKSCVITGAGSGIGRASALAFAREGGRVLVTDLRSEAAEKVADEIKQAGGVAKALSVDVGEEQQLKEMVEVAIADFGQIDVLYNNALLAKPDIVARDNDLLAYDKDVFNAIMNINVLGGVMACKYALPYMLKQGSGSILFTSSGSALGGDVAAYTYGASKAALNSYVKSIAASYGKKGIRSNAILPGPVQTPAKLAYTTPEVDAAFMDILNVPFIGEPEDIAAMAVFLASDESRYVNGALYCVDGGQSCTVPFVNVTRKMLHGE
jgi:NAD(P)-dependent dehydrogenase (short-subunit alcohol dehydrogenase family)